MRHDLAHQVTAAARAVDDIRQPVSAAMTELRNAITACIGSAIDLSELNKEEAFLQSRLALLLTDTPHRWPTLLMSDVPLPQAFVTALNRRFPWTPRFCPARMEVRPLELGLVPHLAEAALQTLEHTPLLRLIVIWGSFASVFGLLFYLTR